MVLFIDSLTRESSSFKNTSQWSWWSIVMSLKIVSWQQICKQICKTTSAQVQCNTLEWVIIIQYIFDKIFMQSSTGTLNSPSSRVVENSTSSRRRILRYINFRIGESSPILVLDQMNLHLITFEAKWILREHAFYCFIIFFILKWILT